METRTFKNSGLQISLLGMGSMRLPLLSDKPKDIDKKAAFEMVDYACQNGVNYFDTAHFYHDGESEKVLGEALFRHPRESFFLATKMPSWAVKVPADAEKIFQLQLKQCRTDYFDFYLCHNLNKKYYPHYEKHQLMDFLTRMKQQGKIRFLGFSFHDDPPFLEKICRDHEWDFAQLQLNYLDWELQDAKTQYEILQKFNLPCIVMEPVRGGALADLSPKANEFFKTAAPDKSVTSWALRYAASLPNVLTVLSGMSNMEQLKDNIATLTNFQPITADQQQVIDRAVAIFKEQRTVPCTACRYCMECPSGVDIPGVLRLSNQYALSKNMWEYFFSYSTLDENTRAHCCTACGVCVCRCPQGINIPEQMAAIAAQTAEISNRFGK